MVVAVIIIRTSIGLMSHSTWVLLDEALPDDELP